jgi:hypothetical protein
MHTLWLPAMFAVLALSLSTGCQSISDSVTSPSRWLADSSGAIGDSSDASADSSNAWSKSSSGSSSGDDEAAEAVPEARYRDDLRLASHAWATRDGSSTELAREIGQIALRHGVLDWQASPSTWSGVDSGLRESGMPAPQVDRVLEGLGRQEALRREADDATL